MDFAQAAQVKALQQKLEALDQSQAMQRMVEIAEKAPRQLYLVVDGSSGDIALEGRMAGVFEDAYRHMAKVLAEVFEMWKAKQHDYGPGNIAQMGEIGVATRANDKVQRLMHLKPGDEANEPVIDSWLDLCDYGAIGAAVHRGLWPTLEPVTISPDYDVIVVGGEVRFYAKGALLGAIDKKDAVLHITGLQGGNS